MPQAAFEKRPKLPALLLTQSLMLLANVGRKTFVCQTSIFLQNLVGADEETVARAVDGLDLNLEDFGEDEDDCASFVDLGKNMTNVTADGGVKKKVIKPGLEMEGLVPARGTVTIHYKMFVEGQDESFDSTWMRMKPERFQVHSIQTICYTCNALRMHSVLKIGIYF